MMCGSASTVVGLFVLVTLGCGAAAGPPPATAPQALYSEADYTPYAGEGSGSISGQAFLRTRGGDVKYGAGSRVTIEPATAYSRDWVKRVTWQSRPPHPAVAPFRRETLADGEGRFAFEELPAGEWIVMSNVNWEVVTTRFTSSTTGGPVGAIVPLEEGEEKSVILQYMGR